jgi:hypothetical protein
MVKDNKKGYTILFDERMIPYLPHTHLTPQGLVDLDTPYKNPRPSFDSTHCPEIWAMAIND